MDEPQDRVIFEAAHTKEFGWFSPDTWKATGDYCDSNIQTRWLIWKAAFEHASYIQQKNNKTLIKNAFSEGYHAIDTPGMRLAESEELAWNNSAAKKSLEAVTNRSQL